MRARPQFGSLVKAYKKLMEREGRGVVYRLGPFRLYKVFVQNFCILCGAAICLRCSSTKLTRGEQREREGCQGAAAAGKLGNQSIGAAFEAAANWGTKQ